MPDRSNAATFVRGPRFYEGEEGRIMFVHQLDSRSSIGPREATSEDIATHPEAYSRMGEEPESPLGPRVVVIAEAEAPKEERPFAERRAKAKG